ncbi:hypothetical protein CDAR_40171 [Caerostris darwini]|uniref:Uncharacterized protein n=1 Tax=Caerostris darwini TaxID=1538125 RepID=A0AAV4R8A7_9ARAC|nr:hypothetical protein CDAR_40171 [Caerostris darwini]
MVARQQIGGTLGRRRNLFSPKWSPRSRDSPSCSSSQQTADTPEEHMALARRPDIRRDSEHRGAAGPIFPWAGTMGEFGPGHGQSALGK